MCGSKLNLRYAVGASLPTAFKCKVDHPPPACVPSKSSYKWLRKNPLTSGMDGFTMVWHCLPPAQPYWGWVSHTRHAMLTITAVRLLEPWIELRAEVLAVSVPGVVPHP